MGEGQVCKVVDMTSGKGRRGRRTGLHDAVRWAAERTQVNAILHVVLLQLGQDVFSIGILPQGGDMGPDLHGDKNVFSTLFKYGCVCVCVFPSLVQAFHSNKNKVFCQHQNSNTQNQ